MKRQVISMAAGCVLAVCASQAQAFDEQDSDLANNTGTCVVWQSSSDGVLGVNNGWNHHHLYGDIVVLDLYVQNLAPNKPISIQKVGYGEFELATYRNDWGNANATADWRFTTGDNRDNIWLVYKTLFPTQTPYRVKVEMNGQTHSVDFRLGRCD